MDTQRLDYLFEQHDSNRITGAEKKELYDFLSDFQNKEEVIDYFESSIQNTPATGPDKNKWDRIIEKIVFAAPVKRMFPIRRIAAAAVILLLLSVGGYFYFNKTSLRQAQADNVVIKDVEAPKTTKATITLANGQKVLLDSIANGILFTQGNVQVIKNANGEIVYDGNATEVQYNTLSNPRGSRVVNLTLHDGTKVWLNAESSLKYPTAFVGTDRKVEITGEAYFEVAHNAVPFIVQKNDVSVKVLGTHFNVNSYEDEEALKITLLEGSVQVKKSNETKLLSPGQQAQIGTGIKVIKVDTEEVMAWKNGFFQFNGLNIQGVMRQLERWYDVHVTYEGKIKEREFAGQIDRNANLSEVLKIMKESNVHFEINGNNIIVKP